ncbi:MAG: hypothetical protein IJC76_00675 [Lachnospiraceae bacterium]|nr:hypothetical protein [Lachnospiraceae bacterium]
MINEVLQKNKINTDADASIKGLGLQKVRAAQRLLEAVIQEKKALYCMIEHVDDVLQGDWQEEVVKYTAEQNKSYSTGFSMNSHEIKNSLRIFFDAWLGTVEMSESIQFVFYTNTNIKKENKVGIFKDIEVTFPEEPMLQLLKEKRYSEAFPFVLPCFKQYYIEQHGKHLKDTEEIRQFQEILDSMTEEKWKKFFDLIEWNFGEPDEVEVRKNIENLVEQLCVKFDVNGKYVGLITAKILDMIEARKFEKDFLRSIVHVAEVEKLFLLFAQEARVEEKLDPMHGKWDEISCNDVRNLNEKFLSVCAEFEKDLLDELEEEYVEGAYEQRHHQNHRQVKAYNYRVYKTCKKIIDKFLKTHGEKITQVEIEALMDNLTVEANKVIQDKAKTYNVAFEDEDMIRKTIILLFQECYLALDEGGKTDE